MGRVEASFFLWVRERREAKAHSCPSCSTKLVAGRSSLTHHALDSIRTSKKELLNRLFIRRDWEKESDDPYQSTGASNCQTRGAANFFDFFCNIPAPPTSTPKSCDYNFTYTFTGANYIGSCMIFNCANSSER